MRKVLLLVCLLSIRSVPHAHAEHADLAHEPPAPARPSLSLTALWLTTSATLLSASLGGYYALQVLDNYERSRALPRVSAELTSLRNETRDLERVADTLFVATAALGLTSLVLLLVNVQDGDSHTPKPKTQVLRSHAAPMLTPHGVGVVWQGWL
jgi:predicted secreted protein